MAKLRPVYDGFILSTLGTKDGTVLGHVRWLKPRVEPSISSRRTRTKRTNKTRRRTKKHILQLKMLKHSTHNQNKTNTTPRLFWLEHSQSIPSFDS